MAQHFFIAVFAPEGWPSSVAPEYGRYQLWDTIQQARVDQWSGAPGVDGTNVEFCVNEPVVWSFGVL